MCLPSLEDRQCCYAERLRSEDLTMGQVVRRFRGLVMGAIALAVSVLLAQGLHPGGGGGGGGGGGPPDPGQCPAAGPSARVTHGERQL
jgi:hypothetical protein